MIFEYRFVAFLCTIAFTLIMWCAPHPRITQLPIVACMGFIYYILGIQEGKLRSIRHPYEFKDAVEPMPSTWDREIDGI